VDPLDSYLTEWSLGAKPRPAGEITLHANSKPGDLIPLDIKIYGLPVDLYAISRLRILKQRKKSAKYTVITWFYGSQQPVKHITAHRLNKCITKFNLVEE
jgi:hypothetical protein